MASFPSSIPSYAGFTSSHTLAQDTHAAQHNAEQADIVALATKVGTGASTPTSNTVLRGTGTGTTAFDQVHLSSDVSGQLQAANAQTLLGIIYPIGCIYTETTGVNPATTFGFGTWTAYGAGRVLVGNGTSDQAFNAGTTGGESNHTLTTGEMPVHNHGVTDPGHSHGVGGSGSSFITGGSGTAANLTTGGGSFVENGNTSTNTTGLTINNAGSGSAHNNLQPYIVVYFWERTA